MPYRKMVISGFEKLKNEIIDTGLCMNCGTCAAVCPNRAISMVYETEEPQLARECRSGCEICYEVCPGKDIPMLDFDRFVCGRERGAEEMLIGIGQSFVRCHATDPAVRLKGGGGGVVSALLIYALETAIIDAAIVVSMSDEHPWIAVPGIATNREEVLAAAQAKETLVPVNTALDEAFSRGFKQLAIVGLPCHVHGLRKIQLADKPANIINCIKLVIGLFCGMNYSRRATEHILAEGAEVPLDQVAKVEYRAGEYPGMFTVTSKNGEVVTVPQRARRHVYNGHEHDRCLVCYDYANDAADVSVGDYFGVEMMKGVPGQSTAITRSNSGKKLVEGAESAGYIHTEPVNKEVFFQGYFEYKKHGGAFRIFERGRFGLPVPDFHLPLDFQPMPRKLNLAHPLIS